MLYSCPYILHIFFHVHIAVFKFFLEKNCQYTLKNINTFNTNTAYVDGSMVLWWYSTSHTQRHIPSFSHTYQHLSTTTHWALSSSCFYVVFLLSFFMCITLSILIYLCYIFRSPLPPSASPTWFSTFPVPIAKLTLLISLVVTFPFSIVRSQSSTTGKIY